MELNKALAIIKSLKTDDVIKYSRDDIIKAYFSFVFGHEHMLNHIYAGINGVPFYS